VTENIKLFTSYCIKSYVLISAIILTHSAHKINNACPDVTVPTTDLNEILFNAK
jgi:hypothetical protein